MKNWSKKKKAWAIIAIVLVLALIAGALYVSFKPESTPDTQVIAVKNGSITETFDTSATVESGGQGVFNVIDGVLVKTVNFRVGDTVKAGDVLATFDTASLNGLLKEKKQAYTTADNAYQKQVAASKEAASQLKTIEKQITDAEAEVARLEKEAGASTTQKPATNDNTSLRDSLNALFGNTKLGELVVNRLLGSGNSALEGVLQGMLNGGATGGWADMLGGNQSQLMKKEMELVELKVKQTALSAQAEGTLTGIYKTVADNAQTAYLSYKASVEVLQKGWIAEQDGLMREVNLVAGQAYQSKNGSSQGLDMSSVLGMITSGGATDISGLVSSLFGQAESGMVIEYYPFVASFSLGKYDIAKIKMDTPCYVTTVAGDKLDAFVSYISPVADTGNGMNIGSLLGSGSASSSIAAKITIPKPDSNVIIGMSVDLSIPLDSKESTMLIPVESLQYDGETKSYYVYKYDADSKTIAKTSVETGLFDGTFYEIVKGCQVGDQVVRVPLSTMEDGQKIKAVTVEK